MLQSPYPYFGGKASVAAGVWLRFGKVDLYNEPFFGSGAMLLGRPGWPDGTTEIINDLWGFVPNFWRAIKADPEAVAMHADIPIYECVPAGTMISTPLGDVAVENIVPGMIVLGERDGQVVETSVVATSKPRMANDFYRVGDLTLTGEHPVWTLEHGYVNARQLPAECTIAVISPVCVTGSDVLQLVHGNQYEQNKQSEMGNLHPIRTGNWRGQVRWSDVSRTGQVQRAPVTGETRQTNVLSEMDQDSSQKRQGTGIRSDRHWHWRRLARRGKATHPYLQAIRCKINKSFRGWRGYSGVCADAGTKREVVAAEEGSDLPGITTIFDVWQETYRRSEKEDGRSVVWKTIIRRCKNANFKRAKTQPDLGRTESKDEGSDQCYNQDARVQGEGQEKSCAPSKAIHVRGDTGSVLVHKRMFAKAGYNTGDNSRNTERANKEVSYYKLDVQVPVNVYNFETGTNNYFANGVLVHNCEQHAIHAMLTGQRSQLAARLEGDVEYYDAKIAGQWVWLMSMWIGHGVLSGRGPWSVELDEEGYSVLVRNAKRDIENGISRALPEMHSDRGVRSNIERKRLQSTQVGVRTATARGVNRKRFQMHEHGAVRPVDLYDWFQALSDRFRDVYVLCGDWSRAVTPSVTTYHGTVGMFLDPPYSDSERRGDLYGEDSYEVAHDVRKWCVENGDNPSLRIAMCGYSGEHDELEDLGWERFEWKAAGGYGNQAKPGSKAKGKKNAGREVIWFSPHCLKPSAGIQLAMEWT